MHFSLQTIAAVAALFAAVDAAPHRSRHGHGTGFPPRPTGGFGGWPFGGNGTHGVGGPRPSGRPHNPSGGFAAPTPTAPAVLPTGGAGSSSVSFESPSAQVQAAASEVDESETKQLKTNSTTAEAPLATSTGTPIIPISGGNSTTGGSAASSTFPQAAGESTLSEPMVIAAGQSFDGKMVRFGRGVSCSGQAEGGDADAVFQIEEGGSLSNVIIGADQSEGIHCMGSCTIENVWWEAVCEDALTIKQESGTSYVKGGGAKGASDKVMQHNGGGTLSVSGFYFEDFGKAYRSCGNCKTQHERHVIMDNVLASGGTSAFVGINTNYGDTATITNSCISDTKTICQEFEGNDTGDEPTKGSSGISGSCIYTEADIAAC